MCWREKFLRYDYQRAKRHRPEYIIFFKGDKTIYYYLLLYAWKDSQRIKKTVIKIAPFKYKGWWYESMENGVRSRSKTSHTLVYTHVYVCIYTHFIHAHMCVYIYMYLVFSRVGKYSSSKMKIRTLFHLCRGDTHFFRHGYIQLQSFSGNYPLSSQFPRQSLSAPGFCSAVPPPGPLLTSPALIQLSLQNEGGQRH